MSWSWWNLIIALNFNQVAAVFGLLRSQAFQHFPTNDDSDVYTNWRRVEETVAPPSPSVTGAFISVSAAFVLRPLLWTVDIFLLETEQATLLALSIETFRDKKKDRREGQLTQRASTLSGYFNNLPISIRFDTID